ncbi:MAG: HPF/RaiA family ribosome-associated protein [Cyclobacteriaceae bacterium]
MKKTIEPSNFDASPELMNAIDTLFDDLDTYNDMIISADIYMESNDTGDDESEVCKIKVFLPGPEIFVEESDTEMLKAAHKTYDVVKRAVIQRKEQDKDKRRARVDKF